jgi:protein O-mannosyl-transferase
VNHRRALFEEGPASGTGLEPYKEEEMTELNYAGSINNRRLALLILLLSVCAVHVNTLFNSFVYDDVIQVVNNVLITDFKYLPAIFAREANNVTALESSNYYRPMMNLVYLISYHLFGGLKPFGFHLVNLALHCMVSIAVFFTAAELFSDESAGRAASFPLAPLVAALIFALQPVNSEVVAWVACVPELTFTLFCLLALLSAFHSRENYDRAHLVSLGCFALGLLSKEPAVVLLPLLVAHDYLYHRNKVKPGALAARYLPYLMVLGGYLVLRQNALGGIAPLLRHPELNNFEVLINVVPLFSQYLLKLLVPIDLNAYYVLHPVKSMGDLRFLSALVVDSAFLGLGYLLFKRSKPGFIGFLALCLPLLPVLNIRWLGQNTFADRYLYFPSIGLGLLAGAAISGWWQSLQKYRNYVAAGLAVLLLAYSVGTVQRNRVWHDELSLWTDTVRKSPDSDIVHNDLGVALAHRGDTEGAVREYRLALQLNPNCTEALNNLGNILARNGQLPAAIKVFSHAIQVEPALWAARQNLGDALYQTGEHDQAITQYREALRVNPNLFAAHHHLGIALFNKGMVDEAIQQYQEAIALRPDIAEVHNNLGQAYARKGDRDAAGRAYHAASLLNQAQGGAARQR